MESKKGIDDFPDLIFSQALIGISGGGSKELVLEDGTIRKPLERRNSCASPSRAWMTRDDDGMMNFETHKRNDESSRTLSTSYILK